MGKVFFCPILDVQEFDGREAPCSMGRSYTAPLLTDTPEEFEETEPGHVNAYASMLVDLSCEGMFRDDLCRLFLLAFFVNNNMLVRISDVLAKHGARGPIFSDYKFVGAKHIKDKEATTRYRAMVREKYKLRFLGGKRVETVVISHTGRRPS